MRVRHRVVGLVGVGILVGCGGQIASSDAQGAPDGGTPGTSPAPTATASTAPAPTSAPTTTPSSPPCESCVTAVIAWGWNGGLTSSTSSSSVKPCSTYEHVRHETDNTASCTVSLAGCGSSQIGGGEVSAAMADPDVQAAFAGSVALYGSDPRGCDGAVLDVTVAGKTLEIGGDCSRAGNCGGTTACTPVPKGLAALADLLEKLDEQELAQPACAGAR